MIRSFVTFGNVYDYSSQHVTLTVKQTASRDRWYKKRVWFFDQLSGIMPCSFSFQCCYITKQLTTGHATNNSNDQPGPILMIKTAIDLTDTTLRPKPGLVRTYVIVFSVVKKGANKSLLGVIKIDPTIFIHDLFASSLPFSTGRGCWLILRYTFCPLWL